MNSARVVDAAFHQTLWNVVPHCSGAARSKSLGVVFGGDVMRLFHGHLDECLTVARSSDGSDRVPTQCAFRLYPLSRVPFRSIPFSLPTSQQLNRSRQLAQHSPGCTGTCAVPLCRGHLGVG